MSNATTTLELSLGEKIAYTKIRQNDLKAAERYKRNCLRIKKDVCIFCQGSKLKLVSKEFKTFRCLSCNKTF